MCHFSRPPTVSVQGNFRSVHSNNGVGECLESTTFYILYHEIES